VEAAEAGEWRNIEEANCSDGDDNGGAGSLTGMCGGDADNGGAGSSCLCGGASFLTTMCFCFSSASFCFRE